MAWMDPEAPTANESRRAMIASQRMRSPMAEPASESNPLRPLRASLPGVHHALCEGRDLLSHGHIATVEGVVAAGSYSYRPVMQCGSASVWKALARGFSKYAKAGFFLSLLFASLPVGAVQTAQVLHDASVPAGVVAVPPSGKADRTEPVMELQCRALHGHCWASVSAGLQGYVPLIGSAGLVASDASLQSVLFPPEPPPPRFSVLL